MTPRKFWAAGYPRGSTELRHHEIVRCRATDAALDGSDLRREGWRRVVIFVEQDCARRVYREWRSGAWRPLRLKLKGAKR